VTVAPRGLLCARDLARREFAHVPGLYGIGIGPRKSDAQTGPCLRFLVHTKRPLRQLPPRDRIPVSYRGVPTDVVAVGNVTLVPDQPAVDLSKVDMKTYSVLRGGIAITNAGNNDQPGTMGCLARTRADHPRGPGRVVLVTCQHVLMPWENTSPGTAHSVGQPDSHGCCESCDSILKSTIRAHVKSDAVLNLHCDSGTAEVKHGFQWAPEIQNDPSPIAIAATHKLLYTEVFDSQGHSLSYRVWKRGITTRITHGTVSMTGFGAKDYQNREHTHLHRRFEDAIVIDPIGSGPFADHGDSGSALMNDHDEIIGIIFAKTSNGGAWADPIHAVQDNLRVEIATLKNTPTGIQVVADLDPPSSEPRPGAPPLPTTETSGSARMSSHAVIEAMRGSALGSFVEAALGRHRDEVLALARRPRVIAAWRRWGGPQIVDRVSNGILPEEPILPRDLVAGQVPLIDGITLFAAQVDRIASRELRQDLAAALPLVRSALGLPVETFAAATLDDLADRGSP
jgi:hypothetical protein